MGNSNLSPIRRGLIRVDTALKNTAKFLRSMALLDILDQLSRISIVIVAITYVLESDDRRREGIYRAWQVVNGAHGSHASGGRVEALEDLAKKGVSLGYINLEGVNLRGAILNGADFAHANLGSADFSGAELRGANFSGADIRQTKFAGADLTGANLAVWGLLNNDLTDANLTNATGITQQWLDNTCGSATTTVPTDLQKPRLCDK